MVDRETFVVIDYVNDQCDMRLKSSHPDCVPDDVVEEIAFELAQFVLRTVQATGRTLQLADTVVSLA
jgi:acyl CoA:acetate/3-ketoacid CoA transferase beta subunit